MEVEFGIPSASSVSTLHCTKHLFYANQSFGSKDRTCQTLNSFNYSVMEMESSLAELGKSGLKEQLQKMIAATGPELFIQGSNAESQGIMKANSEGSGGAEPGNQDGAAPFDLILEFMTALMTKSYSEALRLAKDVLKVEPENKTVQEFLPILEQLMELDDSSGSDDSDEDDSGSGDSDSSTSASERHLSRGDDGSNDEDEDLDEGSGTESDSSSGSCTSGSEESSDNENDSGHEVLHMEAIENATGDITLSTIDENKSNDTTEDLAEKVKNMKL